MNVTTLDAFAAQLGGLHVDFLKIDAEGKDRDVLAGAERQLRDSLSLFSFECAPCAIKQIDINRLDAMGYSCFSLTRAGEWRPSVSL